jgi:hypothetical protein
VVPPADPDREPGDGTATDEGTASDASAEATTAGGRRRVRAGASRRLLVLVAAAVVLVGVAWMLGRDEEAAGAAVGMVPASLAADPASRDLEPYRGQGAWVDAYDFAPAYQSAGGQPTVTPDSVEEMAAAGVRTIFLQAARDDARSPEGVVDPSLLSQFLVRAHENGMRVVGWYLPKFADVESDLQLLELVDDFEVLGHRFDGVAVDIEFTEDVPDHAQRSQRLVELSQRLREAAGDDTVGAIVLPPVQLEVVNPEFWPQFPYRALADLYDVWLPMSYWTFRTQASGYHDGYTYNDESTRRLRSNLGDPNALVHGIGGIGDTATTEELQRFVQSLFDTQAVGGSIYDWNTLSPQSRDLVTQQFTDGPGASLPQPP